MTELILVRHGETDWNVAEVFRGRIDIELNETGIRQAELLAEYLSTGRLEAVYSSPLKRALKTAEYIAGFHHIGVTASPGLVDFDYGKWQGLAHQQVKKTYPELYADWLNCPGKVVMPDGESLDDVRKRAVALVDEVVARHYGRVVLVAHRVVNKVLICALLGLDNSRFWTIRQDTCGISIFTFESGNFVLTRHNDTSYLKPVEKAPLSDF